MVSRDLITDITVECTGFSPFPLHSLQAYCKCPRSMCATIYVLVDGRYQLTQFRGTERIVSPTFPKLELTISDIVAASLQRLLQS